MRRGVVPNLLHSLRRLHRRLTATTRDQRAMRRWHRATNAFPGQRPNK